MQTTGCSVESNRCATLGSSVNVTASYIELPLLPDLYYRTVLKLNTIDIGTISGNVNLRNIWLVNLRTVNT